MLQPQQLFSTGDAVRIEGRDVLGVFVFIGGRGSSPSQIFLSLGTRAFMTVWPSTVKSDRGDGAGVDAVRAALVLVDEGERDPGAVLELALAGLVADAGARALRATSGPSSSTVKEKGWASSSSSSESVVASLPTRSLAVTCQVVLAEVLAHEAHVEVVRDALHARCVQPLLPYCGDVGRGRIVEKSSGHRS